MSIGNAAAVVGDGAGAIGIEGYGYAVRKPAQDLIDGVVDNFIDHVVEARAIVGVADIHAGALAHRIKAFEHLDGIGIIGRHFCFVTLWHQALFISAQGSRFHVKTLGTGAKSFKQMAVRARHPGLTSQRLESGKKPLPALPVQVGCDLVQQ